MAQMNPGELGSMIAKAGETVVLEKSGYHQTPYRIRDKKLILAQDRGISQAGVLQ
jgi:hypothetical protein